MFINKDFFNNTYLGLAVKNVFIAIVIIVVLVIGSLTFIHFYTQHGNIRTVPKIKGKSIDEGIALLQKSDLKVEIIDSLYLKERQLGEIIEQNPAPSTIVKPGRCVYLIVNRSTVKKVKVPNVIDMSLRQAKAYLKSLGFEIERVDYGKSAYRNLIIGLKYNNKTLEPETKIPNASKIVLVAGNGLNNEKDGFPYVVGLDYHTATLIIHSSDYTLGDVHFDTPPVGGKHKYTVYKQHPEVSDTIQRGKPIDLWLTKATELSDSESDMKYGNGFDVDDDLKEENEDIEEFF